MSRVLVTAALVFATCTALSIDIRAAQRKGTANPSASQASRYLIRGATIITVDPALGDGPLGILRNADVRFSDSIIELGTGLEPDGATIIEGHGKIVLPGFVDTHNHLWQSLIRGCGPQLKVDPWIDECVLKKVYFDESQAYWGARLSTVDLIATGVTTVLDWSHSFSSGFTEGNLRALRDSHLRFVFGFMLFGRPGEGADLRAKKSAYIDPTPSRVSTSVLRPTSLERPTWRDSSASRRSSACRSTSTCWKRVNTSQKTRKKMTRSKVLQKAHAFKGKLFVNHAVQASDRQIQFLADHRVSVSHNPLSNLRLAAGVMPVRAFAEHHVRVGLGLDGGANDTSDAFANMRAAVGLQRAWTNDATVFPSVEQVIRMATLGGAEALGMDAAIGSLSPGKRADLIVLNPARANFAPVHGWSRRSSSTVSPGTFRPSS